MSITEAAYVDRLLVDQCLAGDEDAWERLYRQCDRSLQLSIKRLLGSAGNDADLVNDRDGTVWEMLIDCNAKRLQRGWIDRHCIDLG